MLPEPILAALSPDTWQLILGATALAILIYQLWDGWSAGLTRKFGSLLAFIIAYGVAWFGGPVVGAYLKANSPYPRPLLDLAGGAAAGIATFIILMLLVMIFLERTRKKEGIAMKAAWGVGGGVLGLLLGLLWIVLLGSLVRLSGTLAQAMATAREISVESGNEEAAVENPRYVTEALNAAEALDNLPGASLLESLDPMPEAVHRVVAKGSRVASDPEAAYWLLQDASTQTLLEVESLQQAVDDPQVREFARDGRFRELLAHPRIVAVTEDAALRKALADFDLEQALNRAWDRRDVPPTSGEEPTTFDADELDQYFEAG
ncbi:MAG: hypothetical protein ACFBZ8_04220 [Opitutales bacterium]